MTYQAGGKVEDNKYSASISSGPFSDLNNEVNFKEQDPKKDNSNLTKISYPEKPRRSASTSSAQSDQMKSDLPLLHATIPLELELFWSVSTTSAELTNTGSVEEVINAQLNEEAEMMAPDADFADTKTNCGSADVSNAKHEHLLVGSGTQPGQFVDSQRINADKYSVKLPNTLEFFGQDKPAFDPIYFTPHHDHTLN